MLRLYIALIACFTLLKAQQTISAEAIIRSIYGADTTIAKQSMILTKTEFKKIRRLAKAPLASKLVRYYVVSGKHIDNKPIAIVLTRKVRTKKTAVMYFIERQKIKHIEILAFSEPPEFRPSTQWLTQFKNKKLADELKTGDTIAANSGATLSAKAITQGARIALAIYEVKFR